MDDDRKKRRREDVDVR